MAEREIERIEAGWDHKREGAFEVLGLGEWWAERAGLEVKPKQVKKKWRTVVQIKKKWTDESKYGPESENNGRKKKEERGERNVMR